MNLFEQMIEYVRAQQMIACLNCTLKNQLNKFTFLTEKCIVTDGYIGKERKSKGMDNKFKEDMFKSFIIHSKPSANDEMNNYYKSIVQENSKFQTGNQAVITYDAYIHQSVNEE